MDQLNLFDDRESLLFPENLLQYYPEFLDKDLSLGLMQSLIAEVPWEQHPIKMYGKVLMTPRLTAWYGDPQSGYAYSGTKFDPLPWSKSLATLRKKVEDFTGFNFNSVLLNYYRDGNDSVAWHSDNEKELGAFPIIASLSLGQAREFQFRSKADHRQKYSLQLGNGSLLLMQGNLQKDWEHRIPKSTSNMQPRINLTFRVIY